MTTLTGWGRTAATAAEVVRPVSPDEVRGQVARGLPTASRGLGRSYGDPAQNSGGLVLDNQGFQVLSQPGPIMDLGAGVSLDRLLRTAVPAGWFVPVTPGTRHVTAAGAFATDVHGKNHHRDGSFSQHVQSIDLVLADGAFRTEDAGSVLFRATAGGMGLTGFVTGLRLAMKAIETSRMRVATRRAANLDEVMAAMVEADRSATYSVAWVDSLATGRHLGRSVLTTGEHAKVSDLTDRDRRDPFAFTAREMVHTPGIMPNWLLNRATVSAFNEAWYRKAPRLRTDEIQTISAFFHPLDAVARWNRIYGDRGFLQYQFVVPDERGDIVQLALERLSSAHCASFLTVLKRFGPGTDCPLSFPMAGWTLALDIPTTVPGLGALLDRLDEEVLAAGGRIYLAKDSRCRPEVLRAMYPRLAEFEAVRDRVDPDRRWRSDLSARLGL